MAVLSFYILFLSDRNNKRTPSILHLDLLIIYILPHFHPTLYVIGVLETGCLFPRTLLCLFPLSEGSLVHHQLLRSRKCSPDSALVPTPSVPGQCAPALAFIAAGACAASRRPVCSHLL